MKTLSHTVLRVLAKPSTISSEDQETLEKAIAEYPYFQLARTLMAKAKHDQQAPDAYESLGYAAIYSPDRRYLRKVFYEDVHIDWQASESNPAAEVIDNAPAVVEPSVVEETASEDSTNESLEETDSVSEETTAEIEVETSEEINSISEETTTESKEVSAEPEETSVESENPEEISQGVANHDEEEEIVYQELEENLRKLRKAKEESKAAEEVEDKKKIADLNEAQTTDVQSSVQQQSPLLLDYLHGIEPISSDRLGIHQQKQNELINKFVNSDMNAVGRFRPALVRDDSETEDLSEKSGTYSSDLVTENLAEIMLRQGKKEKAIEIYQQLILKMPEKKAYFAEKIEQLK